MRLPIAREGWPFILPLLGLAIIGLVTFPWGGGLLLALAAFVTYFFRDPDRTIPTEPGLFLSPADGKVVQIEARAQGPEGNAGTRISIFLSVFDVHINRAPLAGTVLATRYQPGTFAPAYRSDAAVTNEQNVLTLQAGHWRVVVTQIAGTLARRIVCWVNTGDTLRAGERFGLIRFGSRVEVLIPGDFVVQVHVGQRVRGGETVLASSGLHPAVSGNIHRSERGRAHS